MASQLSPRSFFLFLSSTNTTNDTSRARKVVQHFKRTFAEMVGKSNKFDFTNRNISGVKLGLVIAEAFRKEVDRAQKDHDRQSAKAHKQRLAGVAAAADSGKDLGIHIIDFKAPSKGLGDEGVLAMTPGLHTAIASGSSEAFCASRTSTSQVTD
ncbi:hypothetical protein AMS68_004667 [Peltaster fructicola]|uniref:Uncharacterized protein n=1 Tax=Peltaster fructicola TaxID=286661 RepID=A0A6H0XXK4_9PEZI|nr:hypothetical protein AMS68_004667 [Peltaster fructicola]